MIGVTEMRRGVTVEIDGQLWRVLDYEHYKPGRGNAIIRTKLRNLRTGGTLSRNFTSGERVQDVRLDHRTVQYLYNDGDLYTFMDVDTFEQPTISKSVIEDKLPYLKEGISLEFEEYEGEPIDIELPVTVDLLVTDAPPGYAGDTATAATKEAICETGLKLQVPLFVKTGDVIRVDTRTGAYQTRV